VPSAGRNVGVFDAWSISLIVTLQFYSSPRRRPGPRAAVPGRAPAPHKSFKTWAIIAETMLTALGPGLRRGDDEEDGSRGEHPNVSVR
jgi:hypothetical protein